MENNNQFGDRTNQQDNDDHTFKSQNDRVFKHESTRRQGYHYKIGDRTNSGVKRD